MRLWVLLSVILAVFPVSAQEAVPADDGTRFVTERLFLSLYPEPDSTTERLRLLRTADRLTVLARDGSFAQVRTEDGLEGWVVASFLTADTPSVLRVGELERELAELQTVITEQLHDPGTGDPLTADDDPPTESPDPIIPAQSDPEPMLMRAVEPEVIAAETPAADDAALTPALRILGLASSPVPLFTVIAAFVIACLIGVAGGVALYRRKLSRRFNGLRI